MLRLNTRNTSFLCTSTKGFIIVSLKGNKPMDDYKQFGAYVAWLGDKYSFSRGQVQQMMLIIIFLLKQMEVEQGHPQPEIMNMIQI